MTIRIIIVNERNIMKKYIFLFNLICAQNLLSRSDFQEDSAALLSAFPKGCKNLVALQAGLARGVIQGGAQGCGGLFVGSYKYGSQCYNQAVPEARKFGSELGGLFGVSAGILAGVMNPGMWIATVPMGGFCGSVVGGAIAENTLPIIPGIAGAISGVFVGALQYGSEGLIDGCVGGFNAVDKTTLEPIVGKTGDDLFWSALVGAEVCGLLCYINSIYNK